MENEPIMPDLNEHPFTDFDSCPTRVDVASEILEQHTSLDVETVSSTTASSHPSVRPRLTRLRYLVGLAKQKNNTGCR